MCVSVLIKLLFCVQQREESVCQSCFVRVELDAVSFFRNLSFVYDSPCFNTCRHPFLNFVAFTIAVLSFRPESTVLFRKLL